MAIKLSNPQVNALAGKIKEELITLKVTPVKKANQELYESDEYKNFYTTNEECKMLKALIVKYEDISEYDINRACSKIRAMAFKNRIQDIPGISTDDIIQEIHLATIDASDLAGIIAAVTEKFK